MEFEILAAPGVILYSLGVRLLVRKIVSFFHETVDWGKEALGLEIGRDAKSWLLRRHESGYSVNTTKTGSEQGNKGE